MNRYDSGTRDSICTSHPRSELARRGHQLSVVGDYSEYMGGGQGVMHDSASKVNFGASSPRKDSAAIPEADPYFE